MHTLYTRQETFIYICFRVNLVSAVYMLEVGVVNLEQTEVFCYLIVISSQLKFINTSLA